MSQHPHSDFNLSRLLTPPSLPPAPTYRELVSHVHAIEQACVSGTLDSMVSASLIDGELKFAMHLPSCLDPNTLALLLGGLDMLRHELLTSPQNLAFRHC